MFTSLLYVESIQLSRWLWRIFELLICSRIIWEDQLLLFTWYSHRNISFANLVLSMFINLFQNLTIHLLSYLGELLFISIEYSIITFIHRDNSLCIAIINECFQHICWMYIYIIYTRMNTHTYTLIHTHTHTHIYIFFLIDW